MIPIPLPEQIPQSSSCTSPVLCVVLLCVEFIVCSLLFHCHLFLLNFQLYCFVIKIVLQAVLGMGIGMDVTAQELRLHQLCKLFEESPDRDNILHTGNRHLRNHHGLSMAFSNGCSVESSNILSLVSCMSQRIVTFPMNCHWKSPMDFQWHFPMDVHLC